jgi:hypothetical protein
MAIFINKIDVARLLLCNSNRLFSISDGFCSWHRQQPNIGKASVSVLGSSPYNDQSDTVMPYCHCDMASLSAVVSFVLYAVARQATPIKQKTGPPALWLFTASSETFRFICLIAPGRRLFVAVINTTMKGNIYVDRSKIHRGWSHRFG